MTSSRKCSSSVFVSAKESVDTSTASGRAFFGILATLAQFERELTSERIAANWEQLARSGGLVGPLPCGYTRKDGAIVIDPEPAAIVHRIFAEYATGAHSIRTLAIWANEQGLRPPQQDRGHVGRRTEQLSYWTIDRVRDLLLRARSRRRSSGCVSRGSLARAPMRPHSVARSVRCGRSSRRSRPQPSRHVRPSTPRPSSHSAIAGRRWTRRSAAVCSGRSSSRSR